MRRIAFGLIVLAAGSALADGEIRLEVEQGKTREVQVGYARGWFCDDPSLVQADLVTRNDRNYFVVTGVKVGTTNCRVGTNPAYPPSYVFTVVVTAPKKR